MTATRLDFDPDPPPPPTSLDSEAALLGAAMMRPDVLDEVASLVTLDDFYRPAHQNLWDTLRAMRGAGNPIDPVTVFETLRGRQWFDHAGAAVWLHNLTTACPTTANATYYATLIAEQAARRRLIEAGARIYQVGTDGRHDGDLAEMQQLARTALDQATRATQPAATSVADLIGPYLETLDQPPAGVVPTPWPDLDETLNGGLGQGELILCAARPGVGKTIVGMACARAAAQQGVPTLVFSLEMPRDKVISRIIAETATVPLRDLVRHEVKLDDWDRVTRLADRMNDWPLWIDDRSDISVADIAAATRITQRTHGLGLVVVDYLGLMKVADPRATQQEQVARLSRDLAVLAKELRIPILALHQLNRGPEQRAQGRPAMADLRSSGQLEADAHKILLLWRRDDRPGELTVIVAKHRDGATGDVVLSFSGTYARLRSDFITRNV